MSLSMERARVAEAIALEMGFSPDRISWAGGVAGATRSTGNSKKTTSYRIVLELVLRLRT